MTSNENSVTTPSHEYERDSQLQDLVVWQKGIAFAKVMYQLTNKFPGEEKFRLVAQMRRGAVSIPSNIAAGQARHKTGEFIQFISHAEGSLAELDTQLILSIELRFAPAEASDVAFELISRLRRMLNVLRRKLAARS